jgi:hypothetical protein
LGEILVTINRQTIHEYTEEVPKTLEAFKKWTFSSGSTTGVDFKIFARLFRNYIKKNIPESAKIVNWSNGHYYISGFIELNGKYIYISISDVRHFPGEWHKDILVRTADSAKDYTGGSNGWTTLENFKKDIEGIFRREFWVKE